MAFNVIPTRDCNPQVCLDFLASDTLAYEHLDWLSAQDRLFDPLSFALIEDHTIKAILALSADIPTTAWICFYDTLRDGNHPKYLHVIYAQIQPLLKSFDISSVYLLDLRPWMTLLAETLGFTRQDEVISLAYSPTEFEAFNLPSGTSIRFMHAVDLPEVLATDSLCICGWSRICRQTSWIKS